MRDPAPAQPGKLRAVYRLPLFTNGQAEQRKPVLMRPGSFRHFVTHVIKGNPKPTRAQAVYISVIFDRVDPIDLASDEDRAIARELFGDVERFPDIARDVLRSLKVALLRLARTVPRQVPSAERVSQRKPPLRMFSDGNDVDRAAVRAAVAPKDAVGAGRVVLRNKPHRAWRRGDTSRP